MVRHAAFIVENLIIQSVLLMGDRLTVDAVVITPLHPGNKSQIIVWLIHTYANDFSPGEDEIYRNKIMAMASFSDWIDKSATISFILRLCLLESLGGGGSKCKSGASFILLWRYKARCCRL